MIRTNRRHRAATIAARATAHWVERAAEAARVERVTVAAAERETFYPRTGPEAFTLTEPACITCAHREVAGLDACSAHYVDVWEGAR